MLSTLNLHPGAKHPVCFARIKSCNDFLESLCDRKERTLEGIERRKHPRVETDNHVSYTSMDDNGNPLKKGIGRAVNISQGGILIETHHSFEWQNILLLGIDIENNINRIKGRVVYCNSTNSGVFRTGIEFLEVNERILAFVIHLLKTHL